MGSAWPFPASLLCHGGAASWPFCDLCILPRGGPQCGSVHWHRSSKRECARRPWSSHPWLPSPPSPLPRRALLRCTSFPLPMTRGQLGYVYPGIRGSACCQAPARLGTSARCAAQLTTWRGTVTRSQQTPLIRGSFSHRPSGVKWDGAVLQRRTEHHPLSIKEWEDTVEAVDIASCLL